MKVIGITGGVGCGKSAVLSELEKEYNCIVLVADMAAKELEKKGQKAYLELVELLGDRILSDDGEIDKNLMAQRIFENPDLLNAVNGIIHPAVKEYILEKIDEAEKKGDVDYFFLEAALLIECGYMEIVDEMWYIYTVEEVRRQRLKKQRDYSDEKIDSIMKNQLSEEEFKNNCTFVIDNSYSLDQTMETIRKHLIN